LLERQGKYQGKSNLSIATACPYTGVCVHAYTASRVEEGKDDAGERGTR